MRPGVEPEPLLVVEDDAVLGQVLDRILSQDGYAVQHAQSASEVQEFLKERMPRLILLDVCLRDGRGLELAETLRVGYAEIPVILLTTFPQNESHFPGWSADRLLTKSIDLPDLRRTVAKALVAGKTAPLTKADLVKVEPAIPLATPSRAQGPAMKEPSMRLLQSKMSKTFAVLAIGVLVLAGIAAANGAIPLPGSAKSDNEKDASQASGEATAAVSLVQGKPHTLFVPEDVRTALGIRKDNVDLIAVAEKPTRTRPLIMPGTTALDPTRILRVRALFAPSPSSAQVVEIGQIAEDPRVSGEGKTVFRELRAGDKVVKGNLLAVFYSVDVGNKKNDLIDAIFQKKLDEDILKRMENHAEAVPEAMLFTARRNVEGDRNTIKRAESTLKTWGIAPEDIQAVIDAAEKVNLEEARKRAKQSKEREQADFDRWARVEIKAPEDGIIVERNVSLHEIVVDNTTSLFQIAKLDPGASGPKLSVFANLPEDDVPTLEALRGQGREFMRWTVKTAGSPSLSGFIDDIGWLIDPNQHTAVIKGHIDNREGHIRAGQFISATVEIPPPKEVVEVPTDAVIEDGQQCVVFVESDKAKQEYTMRRVELTNRFDKTVFVRSLPFAKGEEITPEEAEMGMLPKEPLLPGTRVLESGVGELKSVLLDRESRTPNKVAEAR